MYSVGVFAIFWPHWTYGTLDCFAVTKNEFYAKFHFKYIHQSANLVKYNFFSIFFFKVQVLGFCETWNICNLGKKKVFLRFFKFALSLVKFRVEFESDISFSHKRMVWPPAVEKCVILPGFEARTGRTEHPTGTAIRFSGFSTFI